MSPINKKMRAVMKNDCGSGGGGESPRQHHNQFDIENQSLNTQPKNHLNLISSSSSPLSKSTSSLSSIDYLSSDSYQAYSPSMSPSPPLATSPAQLLLSRQLSGNCGQDLSLSSSTSSLDEPLGQSALNLRANSSGDSNSSSSLGHQQRKYKQMAGLTNFDKNSEEYRLRRQRNNIAVRKSRSKSKLKSQQTLERINELEADNNHLREIVAAKTNEIHLLKYFFIGHINEVHGASLTFKDFDKFTNNAVLMQLFDETHCTYEEN